MKNEGLTYKQISNKLNELGYEPTRGKVGEFTPQSNSVRFLGWPLFLLYFNPVKLSKKQINLYNKICELKDEGLTYKQISNKLNRLTYEPSRGNKGEFISQKVWSNYTKIKKNQERKVEVTSLDIDNVKLIWDI